MRRKMLVGGITAAALGVTGLLAGTAIADQSTDGRGDDQAPTSIRLDDRGDGNANSDDSPTPSAQPSSAAVASSQRISMEQAIDEALTAVPNADVTEVELESEHGRIVWSVELASGGVEHEVDVDAETGSVTKVETDDHDDDHHDDDHHDRDDG